jgi:membrane fusion protein, multidrug efflux system
MKRRGLITTAVVVACVLGGAWNRFSTHASPAPKPRGAVPVGAATATPTDVPVYVNALGSVQASKTATITTRVDGQLQQLHFVEGSEVKAGDLLAQIDPAPYQAQLAQAEAKQAQDEALLENARLDVRRYTELSPEDYASKQTLDAARAQVAQLSAQIKADQAGIKAAKTQLAYTSIVAPFAGRTGLRLVDEGNIVRASDSTGIVVITQLQPINVLFTVPQDQLPDLVAAMTAHTVTATAIAADGKTTLDEGTVTLIDNRIDPSTGTVRLRATFDNRHGRMWPGQFVNVRVLVDTLRGALTVPSTAVSQGPHGSFVYVIQPDGTADMRSVTIGHETANVTQITAGLKPGEQVVTTGQYRLQTGAHVRILANNATQAGNCSMHCQHFHHPWRSTS